MSIKTLPPSLIEAVKKVLKKGSQHPYVKTHNDEDKKNEKETDEKESTESMKDNKKKEC